MTANKDKFTCSVCQEFYTDPVVHQPCGVAFDRQCIKHICPAPGCGQRINENDLITNRSLLKIVDEYRLEVKSPSAYYLILLDTSSSMGYSDSWLPFAIGEARFTYAIQFLNDFFHKHLNSTTDQISLVTFDTSTLQRFAFETIKPNHLTMLQNLKCEGKDTALFDSIDFCLEKLQRLGEILHNQMPISYLFIITDGGSNFGKSQHEHATQVSRRSKRLQISGHIIQIGDNNRKKTRSICDFIKFKFNHFNGGNVNEFINSFTDSIKTETQARASAARSVGDLDAFVINQLPEVPTEPVKVKSKPKTLA